MGGAARARDDQPQPSFVGAGGIALEVARRPMGRDHLHLVRDLKFSAGIGRAFHGRPIRVAAHDYTYDWFAGLIVFHRPLLFSTDSIDIDITFGLWESTSRMFADA